MLKRCLGCMEEFDTEYEICPHCGFVVGTEAAEAYHIVPSTILVGRYLIGKVLGFGGFGVTYLGWDKLLEKKVAIKEYLPSEFATRIPGTQNVTVFDGDKNEQFNIGKAKFTAEAKKLALFNNASGIITIYDEFEDNGTAYLVMEYFEGETLAVLLKREGKLPTQRVIEIILPILNSLQEVHDKGIIHRDIAPDNIYITKDQKIKLLDFGAARYATSSYSKSLSVILKPGFAPEEQYRSRGKQGPWSDVYALGATMYYMLTNEVPQEAMERLSDDKLKQPKKIVSIPNNLNNAIMNALVVDAEQRTQSVEEFKNEILNEKETLLKKVRARKREIGVIPRWAKISGSAVSVLIVVLIICIVTGVIDTSVILGGGSKMELKEGETFIPGLLNEYIDDAEQIAEESDVAIQIIDKVLNEKVEANKVLSQDPEAGLISVEGAVINVVVSKGKQQVIVPDVSYMYKDTAASELEQLGFKVKTKEKKFENVSAGSVGEQSIEANDEHWVGGTITLSIAEKKKSIPEGSLKVPKLTDKKLEDAVKEIRKAGAYLVVTKREVSNTVEKDVIISQATAQGESIQKGSVVEVIVSSGIRQIQVPDVQYLDKDKAISALESLEFKVNIEEKESKIVAKGKVISQSIASGTLTSPGKTITLSISTGSKEIEKAIGKTEEYKNTTGSGVTEKVIVKTEENTNTTGSGVTEKTEPPVEKMWTDWTLDASLVNNPAYFMESKTQYSSRERTTGIDYTTSNTSDAISGWDLYDTKTIYSGWGNWSGWSRNAYQNSDTRQIETKNVIDKNAYTKYNYSRWSYWSGNVLTTFYTNKYWTDATPARQEFKETTYPLKSKLGNGSNHIVCNVNDCVQGYWETNADGTWYNLQQTNVPAVTHTEWRYQDRTKTITRYFSRKVYSEWSSWSYWKDSPLTGQSDVKEIQTRNVYRYKEK